MMNALTPTERAKLVAQGIIKLPIEQLLPKAIAAKKLQVKASEAELKQVNSEIAILESAAKIMRIPKYIVAPRVDRPTAPRRSVSECLRLNICCQCREKPAIYYGTLAGHGRNCEPCAEIIRAKARNRRAFK